MRMRCCPKWFQWVSSVSLAIWVTLGTFAFLMIILALIQECPPGAMTLAGMIPRDENSIRNIFKWWFGLFVMVGVSIIILIFCDYLLPIYQFPEDKALLKNTKRKNPFRRARSHCKRRWLRWILLYNICLFVPTVICAAALTYPPAKSDLRFARVGQVTDSTASVQFRSPQCTDALITYSTTSSASSTSFSPAQKQQIQRKVTQGTDYVITVRLTNLLPASFYLVSYVCNDHYERLNFKTNPLAGNATKFSFVFSSDWNNRRLTKVPSYPPAAMSELQPDFFVFLGNFIGVDFPLSTGSDADFYQRRYRNSLANPQLIDFFHTTPTFALLGENDVFLNFEKNAERLCNYNCYATSDDVAKIALNTFVNYLGGTNPSIFGGNFQYYEWDYGDVAMFALDTRQHRTRWKVPDYVDKTMLGIIQKTRLQQWLLAKKTSAKFKLIFSEVGWTVNFNAEHAQVNGRWSHYETERTEILSFIRANDIPGVVLLSGGAHASYVVQISGNTTLYELSASPLAFNDVTDFGNKGTVFLDDGPDRVLFQGGRVASFGESQFGLVTIDTTLSTPLLVCDMYQVNQDGKQLAFRHQISLTA